MTKTPRKAPENSFMDLIPPAGQARRPGEAPGTGMVVRTTGTALAPVPNGEAQGQNGGKRGPSSGPKPSLTYKTDQDTYQRLRKCAFETSRSHQDIIAEAVKKHLADLGY